jgi:hypothetical protein
MMKRLIRLAALLAVLALPLFADAVEPELNAVLSVTGDGYAVRVLVNGVDVGVTGGKSQSMRLFNKGHPYAAKASPQVRARNFVLVPGENEFVIEFSRARNSKGRLSVTLDAKGYPKPLLDVTDTGRGSDRYVLKLRIESKAPADFKPVVIN